MQKDGASVWHAVCIIYRQKARRDKIFIDLERKKEEMKKIRIGSGAGYAGDRLEPALELMEKGNLDYISFECLAERTIALAQQEKASDPEKGYNPLLEYRFEKVLPLAHKNHIKVITNMGAANPVGAAKKVMEMAQSQGIYGLKIAAVTGDDVLDKLQQYQDRDIWETGKPLKELAGEIISANVYMGASPIVDALKGGADIVITGRVSDPALFLAPLIYEFGWKDDDWDKLGKGTLVGHLLECGAQVAGGYYADPGKKDVPGLDHLGFPMAEVSENGEFVVTKVDGSGGFINRDTCIEQMVYEIHDPTKYFTPDVIADFSQVQFIEEGRDRVRALGATGHEKTDTLKTSIGYKDCYIGEGEIIYGGTGAYGRAKLAADVVQKHLQSAGTPLDELKIDFIGVNATYWNENHDYIVPEEVRLRVAGRTKCRNAARAIGREVESLYTNGPAGGGGARQSVREVVAIASMLIDRSEIKPEITYWEVRP